MPGFSISITRFVKKTSLSSDAILRVIALEAIKSLLEKSPVDTGLFRSQWRLGINQYDLTVNKNERSLATFGEPATITELGQFIVALDRVRFGDTLHITNNLGYGPLLEGGLWSVMAGPDGIVGLTFQEIKNKLDLVIRNRNQLNP